MKSINNLLFILLSLVFFCCKGGKKPEIQSGIDECKQCNMVITQMNQACGFFYENNFVTFCSPVCLLSDYEYLNKEKNINESQIFFTDFETKQFIRCDSTYFLFTESIQTVMNAGVVCFRSAERATNLQSHPMEEITDWKKYKTRVGTPDKIVKIKLNNTLVEPGILVFNKNELVQLEIEKIGQTKSNPFFIKGYEEVGKFIFPKNESFMTIKLITDKPGSGFPIMMEGIDQPLGMIKVLGAHTRDEEVM
jgi:hypothetical protein